MWAALPLKPPVAAPLPPPTRRQLTLAAGRQETATDAEKQRRKLSGSDVLMALQRATTKKVNNRVTAPRRKGGDAAGNQADPDIKPLYINPQWAHRLQELETRLHQLPLV